MAGGLLIPPKYPGVLLDADGNAVIGGSLGVYLNGTASLTTIYADAALTIPLANPVPTNAGGVLPLMYGPLNTQYTTVAFDATDTPLSGGAFSNVGVTTDATAGAAGLAAGSAVSAAASAAQAQNTYQQFVQTAFAAPNVPGWLNVATMSLRADAYSPGDQGQLVAGVRTIRDASLADGIPRTGVQQIITSAGSGRGGYAPFNGRTHFGMLSYMDNYLSNTRGGQMTGMTYIHRVGANVDGETLGTDAIFVSGYFGTFESSVQQVNTLGVAQRALSLNIGSVNHPVPGSDGSGTDGGAAFQCNATAGLLTTAIGIGQVGGTWQQLLELDQVGGVRAFGVDPVGNTNVGGYLGLAQATVAQTLTGAKWDPAVVPANALLAVSNGSHGGPCIAVNYGGWKVLAAIASLPALSTS